LLERLLYNRVYNFLDSSNILCNLQFGFRKNYSTSYALTSLTETIRKNLDNGEFACGVFIDLQKAFDTVDTEILIKKLEHYGIRGTANNLFKSYLTNRKQFVSITVMVLNLNLVMLLLVFLKAQCSVPFYF